MFAASVFFMMPIYSAERLDLTQDSSTSCAEIAENDEKMYNLCIYQRRNKSREASSSAEKISKQCTAMWSGNYPMVSRCIKQHLETEQFIYQTQQTKLGRLCYKKWRDNISMLKYCIKHQKYARYNIKRKFQNSPKFNACSKKWGTNYRMVEYCIKKR